MSRLLAGHEAELVAAYEGGATVTDLAARYGCSTSTIRGALSAEGVSLRPPGPRSPLEGREGEVAAAYEAGATVRELVDRFGANQRTIRKVLAEQGVTMRRTGPR